MNHLSNDLKETETRIKFYKAILARKIEIFVMCVAMPVNRKQRSSFMNPLDVL